MSKFTASVLILSLCTLSVRAGGQKKRETPVFDAAVTADKTDAPAAPSMTGAQQEQFTEYILQGFAAEGRDDYAGALELYGKALELDKESVTAWIRHAYVAAKVGRYETTAQSLKQGTVCTPVSVTDYLTLSWFLSTSPFAGMRDGPRAVACALKALKEQESPDAYDMLAAAYAQMGNFGKAQEHLRTAIKLYPDSGRRQMLEQHLELYKDHKPWRVAWGRDEKQLDEALKTP